ncbi:MAG: TetR family transcriptional regulator C-terminal domain-containing protein [Myxococcales bacterium]
MAKKTERLAIRCEQLSQAVVEILANDGRGALTREKISEVAGLSRPLIYYYFNSAEAVMASAFKWICGRILELEEKALDGPASGLDRLTAAFVPDREESRKLYRAFFALLPEAVIKDDLRGHVSGLRGRRRELLAEVLLDAARAGEVRPADGCDLDAIAGLLEGASLRAAVEALTESKYASTIGDAVRRYLRPMRVAAVAA